MNTDVTIIYPPGLQWRFMRQRPQQLCLELAKMGYKVVFGQTLMDLMGVEVRLYKKGSYLIQSIDHPNLYFCYNLQKYRIDHPDERIVFFASSGPGYTFLANLDPFAFIYDECDNFPVHEKYARMACSAADRIIYSAENLSEIINDRRGEFPEITKNLTYVSNACDFKTWNIPYKTLDNYAPPYKILYIGAIAPWLDFETIFRVLGETKSVCEFYFVGANFTQGDNYQNILNLAGRSEVTIIGHLAYEDLPFLMQDADVLWIPFDVSNRVMNAGKEKFPLNLLMDYVNPIKFWEYLATGKPILIPYLRALSGTFEKYKHELPNLAVYDSPDAALAAIDRFTDFNYFKKILKDDLHLLQKGVALENTWEDSAKILSGVIQEMLASNLDEERAKKDFIIKQTKRDSKVVLPSVKIPNDTVELL